MRTITQMAVSAPSKTPSKAEQAYQVIRGGIMDGVYKPGTPLYIRELSILLNISRTPVKEAIDRLAFEGFLELLPERYAIVSKIDYTNIVEILELRECLERACARLAALRRTPSDIEIMRELERRCQEIPFEQARELSSCDRELHLSIAHATYNEKMIEAVEQVQLKMARVSLSISRDKHRKTCSSIQHQAVIAAIAAGDPEGAEQCMAEHIQGIQASVKVYQYNNHYLFK